MPNNLPFDPGWNFRVRSMLNNIPFDPGWNFIQHMIDKFLYPILLWTWIFSNIVITRIHASLKHVYIIAWNILPEWKPTPDVRRCKNRHKPSHGAGIFQTNFVEANYHRIMNAIVNPEGIAVDTLSCVVNQGRLVKIQALQP